MSQATELRVNQPETPYEVFGILVRPVPFAHLPLDGTAARRQHNQLLRPPPVSNHEDPSKLVVTVFRILGHVRLERDAGAFEEDDFPWTIVAGRVAVVCVVQPREVGRHAHGVSSRVDVFQYARVPNALFSFSVRAVVIDVAELPNEGTLADARCTDDRDAHYFPAAISSLICATARSTLASVNTFPISRVALV